MTKGNERVEEMQEKVIRYKKIDDRAHEPTYATVGSAGADLRAIEDVEIGPCETKLVRTGLAIEIPEGDVGLLFPRSGLSMRTTLRQPNSVGVIDSDYRGEVMEMFTNIGQEPVKIEHGDRVCQLVVVPYVVGKWEQVEDLESTCRGAGGFGSTGTR